ncbi:hypothetical protein CEQ90_13710 [Lewinellaceae bacterium SD302]|nr:hypothetical protein CEQ90_13710 [Lewinellaceae bacterium SD302]
MHRFINSTLSLLLFVSSLGAQSRTGTPPHLNPAEARLARKQIDSLFQSLMAAPDVHNAFLRIGFGQQPEDADWVFTGGQDRNGVPYVAEDAFHAASVGKMVTATLIWQLIERGEISLSDPLPASFRSSVHVYSGVDYSEHLTVGQLLRHRSGLGDYIMDAPTDQPSLFVQATQHPTRKWTPADMLAIARKIPAKTPPGGRFHYSDTNYLLLGLLLENHYGISLPKLAAQMIFDPLEMNSTHYFGRSPGRVINRLSECYLGDLEISQDSILTIDWAGGGMVTTTEDLLLFSRALTNGQLISPKTYHRMQNWTEESFGTSYGFGLRKLELSIFDPQLPQVRLIGHTGINGAFLFYCPELDLHLAGCFNQAEKVREVTILLLQIIQAFQPPQGLNRQARLLEARTLINLPEPVFEKAFVPNLNEKAIDDLGFAQPHTHQNTSFQSLEDLLIYGRLFPKEYSQVTVVLVHGTLANSYTYNRTAGLIREAMNAEVLAIDLHGHGQSTGKPGDIMTTNQYADDLEAVIHGIRAKLPGRRIVLAGHSMGGGVILRHAESFPETNIDGYLLYAPHLGLNAPTTKRNLDLENNFFQSHLSRGLGLKIMNEYGVHDHDSLSVAFYNLPSTLPLREYSYRALEAATPVDYRRSLRTTNAPVLIIVGDDDEVFVASEYLPLARLNELVDCTLIKGATHNGIRHSTSAVNRIIRWSKQWFSKTKN